jgi:hypothetical protein
MSSVYRILCLSHDPAIQVADREYGTHESAITVARDPYHHGLLNHARCDLLVGQYSYPLIEVCCPSHRGLGEDGHDDHDEPRWILVEWLRLFVAAAQVKPVDGLNLTIGGAESGCWTTQRLLRLRSEI